MATVTLESELHAVIRGAGLRLTVARRAICRVLAMNGEEFLSTADILEGVEREIGPIDPSTAYRTLDEFARIGLVHHVHHGNAPGRWHLTMQHDHLHLVCERCDETTVVPTDEAQQLLDHLDDAYGFRAYVHHFAVMGLCDSCREIVDHPHD